MREGRARRLVDLKEICAQPMAHDIERLTMERIMTRKLSSRSVVLMVTTMAFLSILYRAQVSRFDCPCIRSEWSVCLWQSAVQKNSVVHLQLFFMAESLYLGIQIYGLSICTLEQFERLSSPAACSFSLPELIAPAAETTEWLAHYVHCSWPGASISAHIINRLGY